MPQIIASTYEIGKEIGAGGGGVVYLGEHIRLKKTVVLKADKRTLATKPEVLRREVDALKNLSHTYIPQVYDFVQEDGVVYTVMDYIEGESLDKPLKRGEHFPQAQVIEWACELLEALVYLHNRPPYGILHGDLKPANIMLTPQGDIRLIDFNIALALGEEGAVRVGFSRGYASPEHYGLDYTGEFTNFTTTTGRTSTRSRSRRSRTSTTFEKNPVGRTEILSDGSTGASSSSAGSSSAASSSTASGRHTVLLDVRSDIYSMGATLYHLFTGVRPAQDAKEVMPISPQQCSPAVSAILQRAMEPDPALRYQTAAEMLYDFEHLHEADPRTKRHKRRIAAATASLAAVFLTGGFATFTGLKQMEQTQSAYALAEYAENDLRAGNIDGALHKALQALPAERSIFDGPYIPQAQKALTEALGVYDLSDGFKAYQTLELPSEPIKVVLSPDGARLAVLYAYEFAVYDMETGALLATFPAEESALSDIVFSGEDTIFYAGEGAVKAYDLAQNKELWSGKAATTITVSADGSTVAAVYKDENLAVVYDAATGEVRQSVTFHDKYQRVVVNDRLTDMEDNLLALNRDGTLLAVSFADGGLMIYNLQNSDMDIELFDVSDFVHYEGGFYGDYFAFSATAPGDSQSVVAVIDTVEAIQTGGFSDTLPFHVMVDESGIYVSTLNILVRMDPVTGEQEEVAYTDNSDITAFSINGAHTLVATKSGAVFFDHRARQLSRVGDERDVFDFVRVAGEFAVLGSRNSPVLRFMKLQKHPDAQMFTYDADFQHDEARVSADGRTLMLFRFDAFRLYDEMGDMLAEVEIPEAEQVNDQQYRRDENGSYLEVIYNDGMIRKYSAEDGSLLSEEMGEKPDLSLYEEFETDHLRITAPLHETPVAYDKESGKEIRELEKDDYITYATQLRDMVVTEYISPQGERYGLLLNEECETLAKLPELCDIVDGSTLVFDDMRGNIRQSPVYSLEQLMRLARH